MIGLKNPLRLAALLTAPWLLANQSSAQDSDPDRRSSEEVVDEQQIVVTAETEEEPEEVCRYVQLTGTRFRQRICMTQQEQREQMQNNRDVINDNRYEGAPIIEYDDNGFPTVPPT